jgi:hypothetical protein
MEIYTYIYVGACVEMQPSRGRAEQSRVEPSAAINGRQTSDRWVTHICAGGGWVGGCTCVHVCVCASDCILVAAVAAAATTAAVQQKGEATDFALLSDSFICFAVK